MGRHRKNPPRFPLVDEVIMRMGGVLKFCQERYFTTGTYYSMQSGRHEPALPVILEILNYTGLTFEEAFMNMPKKEEKAPECPELREKNIPARADTTNRGKTRKEML